MKFKNIKKSPPAGGKNPKSPSNSRINTEHPRFSLSKNSTAKLVIFYKKTLKIFAIFIFIVTAIIVGMDVQRNLQIKQDVDLQRKVVVSDLNFWENFISQQQNYRDAYLQASVLEYKLGNISKAKTYVEKALSLDPNSVDAEELEQFLTSK